MNILAGSLFLMQMPLAAYVVGGCLLILQAIVIATHFCVLSWMYEGVARMLGSWNRPLEPQVAREYLQQGATVIDVRSPQEFANQHLACAINLPLESLADHLDQVPRGTLLLHCKSGMRSNMALHVLRRTVLNEPTIWADSIEPRVSWKPPERFVFLATPLASARGEFFIGDQCSVEFGASKRGIHDRFPIQLAHGQTASLTKPWLPTGIEQFGHWTDNRLAQVQTSSSMTHGLR